MAKPVKSPPTPEQTAAALAVADKLAAEHNATVDKENGTMSDLNNSTALGTVTIKIDDMDVPLPVRFAAGHALTEHEAKVIDAAYQRQFKNNQDANAKNRAARLAKADTDEARKENAPWTAAQYAAEYMSVGGTGAPYQPTVGDTVRQSALEKMQQEAALRFYSEIVIAEHNAAVGAKPPLPSPWFKHTNIVAFPSKPLRGADGKVTQTVQEQRDNIATRLLAMSNVRYVTGIQTMLDAIKAASGKGPAAPEAVVASLDDLADDLAA